MSASLHCFGALALEVAAPPSRTHLDRAETDALGDHLAIDLQRLLPEVEQLDLVLAGAHFDPAELLRPGWPVHAALVELASRVPGTARGRVIAFGAHDGRLPTPPMQPDIALAGGPLRVLPFALQGDADVVARVGRAMEERLLETGMAGAATALHAQHAFGGRLEHARYLSLHDLCAMIAMQYDHAGLPALWPLIEAALLAPESQEWLDAPPEPLLLYRDGEVRMAKFAFDAWCESGFAPAGIDPSRLSRAFDAFNARLRQYQAVLGAHGITVREIVVDVGRNPRESLENPG